ncbi:TraX family protein [Massilia sp. H6]|uniref:TraX family protein n=1 Tax=Massilia sp. H6 TaxID=2970464 RepID=UPI00216A30D8|nr:TraX family protein [Massilia sp. H6]UVW30737.1 TraX family protein [Massilia sp. H6]
MKWCALILMTLDHINKYLFNHTIPALFALGRIAMPLFVFVLAYNLARPGALEKGVYRRTATRLALYGLLACLPFIALGKVHGGWWPLNIMFTLLVATVVIGLMAKGGRLCTTLAIGVFIVGGGLVEYWWFAVGLAVICWRYCARPATSNLVALVACFGALWLVNQNPWAFAALPLIVAAPRIELSMPRLSQIFYLYYPAHLGVLFVVSKFMH